MAFSFPDQLGFPSRTGGGKSLGIIENRVFTHTTKTMKTITHWIPAGFCAFICLLALFFAPGSPGSEWWKPVFLSFLPMCFFFVGVVTSQTQREIRELRKQVSDLQNKQVSSPDAA